MSDMGNFADLANVKAGDVKPPALPPIGTYKVMITGPMTPHKAQTGNQAMRFPFQPVEPGPDVDAEAFAAFQSEGGFGEKKRALDFWMSPDARFRFTNFGISMGHSDQLNLLELAEALATSGEPFYLSLTHGNNAQGEPAFERWDSPTPIS